MYLVAPDALLRHLALHKLLVGPEVDTVSRCFTPEGDNLPLVQTCNAFFGIDLFHKVPGARIYAVFVRLYLQT